MELLNLFPDFKSCFFQCPDSMIGENFRVICWLRFQLYLLVGWFWGLVFPKTVGGMFDFLRLPFSTLCRSRACYEDVRTPGQPL